MRSRIGTSGVGDEATVAVRPLRACRDCPGLHVGHVLPPDCWRPERRALMAVTGSYVFVVPSHLTAEQCQQLLATSALARQRELDADRARVTGRLQALLYLSGKY